MLGLEISGIYKAFGKKQALRDVSFTVARGEIVTVLGPSGCGKSTLLAIVAGLEIPDRGEVFWDGLPQRDIPPHRRGFGLMFQDLALFPHMDVAENVAFGLRMANMDSDSIRDVVENGLAMVGLTQYGARDVNTLSGGERQRVALARALAPQPRLLMLDEPLGSLDRTLREELLKELPAILRQTQQTAMYVTHDQEEAFALADRVVLINDGAVVQIGSPQEIYCRPASVFVARFLGLTNLLPGIAHQEGERYIVRTPVGEFPIRASVSGPVMVLIRPDAGRLDEEGRYQLTGVILESDFRGAIYQVVIEVLNRRLTFYFPSHTDLPPEGAPVRISIDPGEAIQVFEVE
jgi:ABC-type Fe3+/spermidine/putrescine transport system ATPase subunit